MIRVHMRGFHGIDALPERRFSVIGSVLSMATRDLTNGHWSGLELVIDELEGPVSVEIEFENSRRTTDVKPLTDSIKALFEQRLSVAIPVAIRPMIATL